MTKNLLSVQDLTLDEINYILRLSGKFKEFRNRGSSTKLKGKTIGLIFGSPSTRTRISFAVGIHEMGGYPLFLDMNTLQLKRGETIKDTANVLNRYIDMLVIRAKSHETIKEFARHSKIPVINAQTSLEHPCQILSDLFTIKEHFKRLNGLKLAFVGDGNNNVTHSLLLGSSSMGIDISVACPRDYRPKRHILELSEKNAKENRSRILITNNVEEAVKDADVVYNDTFISAGHKSEREKRLKDFKKYRVNSSIMGLAKKQAIYMHNLPNLHIEVSDDVFYGKQSIVWQQAENRLHVQKAIMLFLSSR